MSPSSIQTDTDATGDEDAMAQLLDTHGPLVWQTVYRLVNHDADARECYQETFMSAWQMSQTQAIHSWPALLKKVATNKALDKLRERYRRQKNQTKHTAKHRTSHYPPPEQAAEANELADRLRDALPKLPANQRAAFVLSCLEHHPNDEVAKQLNTTISNTRLLVHRARVRLRELLENRPNASLVETPQ